MDHIITVSEANKMRLQHCGIETSKMAVVPNTIDPEEFLGAFQFNQSQVL